MVITGGGAPTEAAATAKAASRLARSGGMRAKPSRHQSVFSSVSSASGSSRNQELTSTTPSSAASQASSAGSLTTSLTRQISGWFFFVMDAPSVRTAAH